MSEGKAADDLRVFDDLGVFDDLAKAPSTNGPATHRGTLPPPPAALLSALMAPVSGRAAQTPTPSVPPVRPSNSSGASASVPPPVRHSAYAPPHLPPTRAFSAPPPPPASEASRPLPSHPVQPPLSFAEPLPLPGLSDVPPGSPARSDVPAPDTGVRDDGGGRNPFLTPIAPVEDGGPVSLLPPAPGGPRSLPPVTSPTRAGSAMTSPTSTVPVAPSRAAGAAKADRDLLGGGPVSALSLLPPSLAVGGTVPPHSSFPFGEKRPRRSGLWIAAACVVAIGAVGYSQRGAVGPLGAANAQRETASLSVQSTQPGVRLSIDGRDVGTLPQDASGLSPGEHVVIFEGDRYVPEKTTITLAPGEKKTLPPVGLKIAKGAAKFEVLGGGAHLALVSSDERRALTDYYSRSVDIDTSKTWILEATKAGFKTVLLPITFDHDAEKTFTIAFNESDVQGPAHAESGNVELAAAPQDRPDPPPSRRTARASGGPASAVSRAVVASGNCTLNLNSIPASKVVLDGRPLGMTPKVNIAVPAGAHMVVFAADGARKSASTTCKAGERKTVAFRF
jgi:hypothetical protein